MAENIGLFVVFAIVLLAPFLVKRIEHNLEFFFLVMGAAAASVAGVWSGHLVEEASVEPIKIALAVLGAGLLFHYARRKFRGIVLGVLKWMPMSVYVGLTVIFLGLLSSVISAIVASLILLEQLAPLRMDRGTRIKLVVVACLAIGLGAALTPLGEPLSTIAIAKLDEDFWYLAALLGLYIAPGVVLLGLLAAWWARKAAGEQGEEAEVQDEEPETLRTPFFRGAKVYAFVFGLVLLGGGFEEAVESIVEHVPDAGLYWGAGLPSAILDNAMITATVVTPTLTEFQIKSVLMGLLVCGVMLIPGNIPNIIAAGKLRISSKEWVRWGIPIGLVVAVGYFGVLYMPRVF